MGAILDRDQLALRRRDLEARPAHLDDAVVRLDAKALAAWKRRDLKDDHPFIETDDLVGRRLNADEARGADGAHGGPGRVLCHGRRRGGDVGDPI